jgi:lipopolysaccharide biosynthesis regulator YciM
MPVGFDLLWLLVLPVLFALGWFSARVDMRHVVKDAKALPQEYYKAVESLLNHDSEEAVQNFLDVLRLSPETVEVNFTLGNVLRKRGDVERAIRVHQNLVSREDLPLDVREKARFELAQDFVQAGIFDRAEQLLTELLNTRHAVAARKHLLSLYPSVQEWDKAFEMANAVEQETGQSYQVQKAHFLCMAAQQDVATGRIEQAIQKIQQAKQINPNAIRPLLLQAEIEAGQGLWQTAVSTLTQVAKQHDEAIRLVAPMILKITQEAAQTEVGFAWIEKIPSDLLGVDALENVVNWYVQQNNHKQALEYARSHWQKQPDLARLGLWLRTATEIGQGTERELAQTLLHSLGGQLRKEAKYRCQGCGFHLKRYSWQCPGCLNWESFSTYRADEKPF